MNRVTRQAFMGSVGATALVNAAAGRTRPTEPPAQPTDLTLKGGLVDPVIHAGFSERRGHFAPGVSVGGMVQNGSAPHGAERPREWCLSRSALGPEHVPHPGLVRWVQP